MKLEHIKEESCSKCGSKAIIEKELNQHTNGLFNEERIFACGRTLHFSPNFKKVTETSPCTNNDEEKIKEEKRAKTEAALYDFVNKLDVDDEFKETIKNELRFIY